MSNPILIENIRTSLVIRFNRPEVRNPLSISVIEELSGLIPAASVRQDINSVIFTGTGESFASGADLREIALVNSDNAEEFALRGQNLMSAISRLPFLTIAAVNGFCFGGALDLALSCKMRIASPDAVFSHPGANLGIMTGWGGTQRLPHLIGEAAALEMFMTAKRVPASEALSTGLADEVVHDPLSRALEIAEGFTATPRLL